MAKSKAPRHCYLCVIKGHEDVSRAAKIFGILSLTSQCDYDTTAPGPCSRCRTQRALTGRNTECVRSKLSDKNRHKHLEAVRKKDEKRQAKAKRKRDAAASPTTKVKPPGSRKRKAKGVEALQHDYAESAASTSKPIGIAPFQRSKSPSPPLRPQKVQHDRNTEQPVPDSQTALQALETPSTSPASTIHLEDLKQSCGNAHTSSRVRMATESRGFAVVPIANSTARGNLAASVPELSEREWSLIWRQRRLSYALEKKSIYGAIARGEKRF